MFKNTKYYFILSIFLASCAVIQDPKGGPPDTVPPQVKSVSVKNQTINFAEKEILIEFTKWMSNNKVTDNLSISPSIKTNYKWRGKKLKIVLDEPLLENTTYSLQLGTDYTDWKNNKPEQAFNLVFSTGNIIDTGRISGEFIADKKLMQGAYLFLYRIDNIDKDTLNPSHTKANYKSQIGSSGIFEILALKDGLYRAFAVKDVYKDDVIDLGTDNFGAAGGDIEVHNGEATPFNISLGPPADKQAPQLFTAKSIDNRTIELSFDESIDISTVDLQNINVYDENSEAKIKIISFFPNIKSAAKISLISDAKQDTSINWKVKVRGIADTLGNTMADTMNTSEFYVYDNDEYISPEIIELPFKDSTFLKNPESSLAIKFNTAIADTVFDDVFRLSSLNDSVNYEISISKFPDNIIQISGNEKLEHNEWYKLVFNPSKLSTFYGDKFNDTIYSLRFKNYDKRNFSKVTGKIEPENLCENMLLEFRRGDILYQTIPDENGSWSIEQMADGKYEVTIICDGNNNNRFDYGFPYPIEFSEQFYVLKKEIIVRAGWDIEELILKFEK